MIIFFFGGGIICFSKIRHFFSGKLTFCVEFCGPRSFFAEFGYQKEVFLLCFLGVKFHQKNIRKNMFLIFFLVVKFR